MAEVEKQHIRGVLEQASGDVRKAAEVLRIDEVVLKERMREHGLEAPKS